MRAFDAVLFDLGSTLIYFSEKWEAVTHQFHQELIRSLKDAGFLVDPEPFLHDFDTRQESYYNERDTEFIEYTTAYILKSLLADYGYTKVPDQVIQQALKAMYAVSQAYWKIEEETISTLETLRNAGYRMAIVSNAGDDADVQSLIDNTGIRPYFDVVVTSASQGIRKPNPRIFRTALDKLGVMPEKAVMVGDTLGADILGAHNAGMPAIWITRRADKTANRAHEEIIHPDATISGLDELPELLERWLSIHEIY
ncbi:MAG: HAD family hydrolase [Omnitrophica WOR_2 bacterium]